MFISIAVPVPTLDLLTYRVPDGVPSPSIGARVIVPLGSRAVTGIVVACDIALPDGMAEQGVKSVTRVMDDRPFIPSDVVSLAQWTAEYYAAGAGETITAVLPPKSRDERADAHKTRRLVAKSGARTYTSRT